MRRSSRAISCHNAMACSVEKQPAEALASARQSGRQSRSRGERRTCDEPWRVCSAARHGRHRDVEAALLAGFDPDTSDPFGNTIFHIACQNGNKRIAKLAIKHGGNMDAQNERGNTGLHFLFSYGFHDVAEYFISKGANEHLRNSAGLEARLGIR